MYDHLNQYRCTIIRGKSQKEMDDFLPIYAKIINEICPCNHKEFEEKFNQLFQSYLTEKDKSKKTMDNHRTEIAGKLFGMYYFSEDGNVYESERTQKFLEDNDQPAFFKDICYKMQFPNGSQKIGTTVKQRVEDKINIRSNAFLLKVLLLAEEKKINLNKKEIGYYILNSLDVLKGIAKPNEVLEQIIEDRENHIVRNIIVPGKQSSYNWQHIKEQLNYLELANLISLIDGTIFLNNSEKETISLFAADWNKEPEFNVYNYDLNDLESRKQLQFDWDLYFSKISDIADKFETKVSSLLSNKTDTKETTKDVPSSNKVNLVQFGDEGEEVVFNYEKERVYKFNPRLVNKVLSLGKVKGLGYDIQSVIAEPGDESEFVKYIEVKSTKRITSPDLSNSLWIDSVNLTRNEWTAAKQHKDFYYIYRVYFTREGINIYILKNPAAKFERNEIGVTPINYRLEFSGKSVDSYLKNV